MLREAIDRNFHRLEKCTVFIFYPEDRSSQQSCTRRHGDTSQNTTPSHSPLREPQTRQILLQSGSGVAVKLVMCLVPALGFKGLTRPLANQHQNLDDIPIF